MPRLRTVSTRDPGWRRVRHGRGHRYLDTDGTPLGRAEVEWVKSLVIPPAWRDVWISPYPNAHLRAVGTDESGRRQYLYHPVWREKRDAEKFDRVIEMAAKLPAVRRRLRADLDAVRNGSAVPEEAALAAAVRLVDLGCFRLGSEESAEQFGSYGLTTLERRHVRREDGRCLFAFVGKGGIEHDIALDDEQLCRVISRMTRGGKPDDRLLKVKSGRRWEPLQAGDINDYIREQFDLEVTAKDFRTWHATVHVAKELGNASLGRNTAGRPPSSRRARTKAVRDAIVGASDLLGNTPTVAKSSYVDPRVVDLYEADVTIAPTLLRLAKDQDKARDQLDRAVVKLLRD